MASAMLDIQSLPSLERFDSQLLDLFRQGGNEAGGAGVHVMDELQAPDDDLALQRLMSLKTNQQKAAAAALQQQQQLGGAVSAAMHPTSRSPDTPTAHPHAPHTHHHAHNSNTINTTAAGGGPAAASGPAGSMEGAHTQVAVAAAHGSEGFGMMASAHELMARTGGHIPTSLSLGLSSLAPDMLSPFGSDPFAAAGLAAAYGIEDSESPLTSPGFLAAAMAGGGASNRLARGAAMADLIKMEQECAMECEGFMDGDFNDDGRGGNQSPAKRKKNHRGEPQTIDCTDSDYEEQRVAGLSITADMDEATRARIRREKNRVAARKCRAKKMQFMVELQKTLRELMRKNEEYRLQVITWHKMFSREVRLREAMKRIIAVMWQSGVPPAASGYTANDVIIGLESGTLDVNSLVRSLAVLGNPHSINPSDLHAAVGPNPSQAAAALANPTPLVLGNAPGAAGGSMSVPVTPRVPPGSLLHMQLSDVSTQAADLAAIPQVSAAAAAGLANNNGSSPLTGEHHEGMLPMSLLMAQSSHVPEANGIAAAAHGHPMSPTAAQQVNALKMAAAAGAAGAAGAASLQPDGLAGLPDIAGQEGGLQGTWMWATTQGFDAPAVGPSCVTTGAE